MCLRLLDRPFASEREVLKSLHNSCGLPSDWVFTYTKKARLLNLCSWMWSHLFKHLFIWRSLGVFVVSILVDSTACLHSSLQILLLRRQILLKFFERRKKHSRVHLKRYNAPGLSGLHLVSSRTEKSRSVSAPLHPFIPPLQLCKN